MDLRTDIEKILSKINDVHNIVYAKNTFRYDCLTFLRKIKQNTKGIISINNVIIVNVSRSFFFQI
jgi:hypothetical protein